MRILYGSGNILVSQKMGGGASSQIIGFTSALEKAGHQVDLDISGEERLYPQVRTSSWMGWIRTKLPISWLAYESLQIYNNRNIRKRLDQLDLSSYDLLWQRYELFTTAYAECAHRAGLPIVLFVDAPLIIERQTYNHLWLKNRAIRSLRENARLSDLVIAVSEQIADYVREFTADSNFPVMILPNGYSDHINEVDPNDVWELRQRYFGDSKGRIIGFVGSPMAWHRLDYLIRVIHRLTQMRNDFRALIVGDGPDLPNQIKLVDELLLNNVVKFTGRIPFKDIGPYLHAIDIGVMPDSNLYGSPMKITEYMACEAVVIAPDLPPISALCTNEVEGLLFPKDDVDGLYRQINRLLDDPEKLEAIRRRAKERALRFYSWQARITQLEDMLKGIVKQPN